MSNFLPAFWAVIPAAGVGARMAADRPKQYLQLGGRTILEHSLGCFLDHPGLKGLVVSVASDDPFWPALSCAADPHVVRVDGGRSCAGDEAPRRRRRRRRGEVNLGIQRETASSKWIPYGSEILPEQGIEGRSTHRRWRRREVLAAETGEPPDRKSTRLNSSHYQQSRMPSSA